MTRLFLLLLMLTLFSCVAMWFVENDGSIVIRWMNYHIQTSVSVASLVCVVFVVLCAMVLQFFIWLKNYPNKYKKELKEKRRDQGLTALTEGFAAVAAGDAKQAKRLTKKATHNLGPIPLTKLLCAQTAQLEGDKEEARIHYTAMLENKETEMIAIKGLLIQARQEGDLSKAIFLAEKALNTRPDAQWAISILIDLYKRTRQWDKAEKIIEKALKKKCIDAGESKRALALISMAKAIEIRNTGQNALALKLVYKAHRLLPDSVPIITTYTDILIGVGQQRKAIKVLEAGWRLNPHPDIALHYMKIFSADTSEKRLQRAEKLHNLQPNHVEGHLVVARTAMAAQNFSKARNHLKMALAIAETSTVCRLMAELERQENAGHDVITNWENRSEAALTDPMWHCKNCGYIDRHWHINCHHCEAFDSLCWKETAANENIVHTNNTGLLAQA